MCLHFYIFHENLIEEPKLVDNPSDISLIDNHCVDFCSIHQLFEDEDAGLFALFNCIFY